MQVVTSSKIIEFEARHTWFELVGLYCTKLPDVPSQSVIKKMPTGKTPEMIQLSKAFQSNFTQKEKLLFISMKSLAKAFIVGA